ncbi:hypothetical protein BDZ89DRAFT_1050665 [Hymenopellis radicata]|nr:hypothetical protein BDZ89DRAFT_1050665 [Hymenopellis radicata]
MLRPLALVASVFSAPSALLFQARQLNIHECLGLAGRSIRSGQTLVLSRLLLQISRCPTHIATVFHSPVAFFRLGGGRVVVPGIVMAATPNQRLGCRHTKLSLLQRGEIQDLNGRRNGLFACTPRRRMGCQPVMFPPVFISVRIKENVITESAGDRVLWWYCALESRCAQERILTRGSTNHERVIEAPEVRRGCRRDQEEKESRNEGGPSRQSRTEGLLPIRAQGVHDRYITPRPKDFGTEGAEIRDAHTCTDARPTDAEIGGNDDESSGRPRRQAHMRNSIDEEAT